MDIESILEKYILAELIRNKTHIPYDQSLISSGMLDSLRLLQLIAYIEEQFEISVENQEINPDNFQTINTMKAFIELKQHH